jgi:hypothetical protein
MTNGGTGMVDTAGVVSTGAVVPSASPQGNPAQPLLKRSIKGTYVSVEPFHLFRYVDEQAFRFNNRLPLSDGDRFSYLVRKIVGKRLTYAELTGKTEEGPRAEEVPF